jgi:Zn-dependent protease
MSVKVGKIKAIPIRLHFTLVLTFFLISWTLASRLMPELYPGLSISSYWLMGAIGAIIVFASVLLHELAHSLVALRYGLRVRQIILFIFGGVSEIDEEESSKDFRKEFNIAVAGPITSFIISAILSFVWLGILSLASDGNGNSIPLINTDNISDETLNIAVGILYYGAFVNALIGGFNLIPVFPLDGGRILRSALLRWRNDYDQATKIASKIGIVISYGFIGLGFLLMIGEAFISGIWLVFIGWFLNSGAQS